MPGIRERSPELMDERALVLEVPIALAWGEMDAFGHANNVAYFRWLETARMHYLRRIGVTHPDEQDGIGLLLAETRCRFLKPLTFPDQLLVRCGVREVGNQLRDGVCDHERARRARRHR
jgi:acyl-CoA thioester hydrolase